MATGTLIDNTTTWSGDFQINKQTGTLLTLSTTNAFVDKPIALSISAQLASPSFDGGALNNKAATAAFTNMTTSSTDTSGVAIQAAGAAGRDAVLYNGAVNGWVIASDNASASAAVSTENWTGTTYYATGVTLGNGKTFDITVPNGANATVTFRFTVDASGNTTVTSVES